MTASWQPRAFFQRFVVALVVTTVFTAGAIGSAYWVAADKIDSAKKARFDPGTLADADRGKPANFLIIGSDSRAFVDNALEADQFGEREEQTGQRSDTIMIAHVDPENETGMIVSFPRDLWVDVPGKGGAKLNSAFNGGHQLLVETLKENFDIPIHHYLEIDFDGFRKIVDAVGTIPVYFPTPASDAVSGLRIDTAGCHELNGEQALAYARSREYRYIDEDGDEVRDGTADLGRIRRQQYFIRSLANEAVKTGFRNPTKINDLLNKTVDGLTLDPGLGLSDFLALAKTFKEVDPAVVEMVTVPTTREEIEGQDAQALVADEAEPIFERLRRFGAEQATTELPEGVVAADVHPVVLNGSGVGGQARIVFDALSGAGFAVVGEPSNADRRDYETTEIRYAEGAEDAARYTRAYLGGVGKLVNVDDLPEGANVVIVLGRDFEEVAAPSTTAAGATTVPAPTAPSAPANPGGEEPLPAAGC